MQKRGEAAMKAMEDLKKESAVEINEEYFAPAMQQAAGAQAQAMANPAAVSQVQDRDQRVV